MTDVPASSATEDLVLHGIRVLGFAPPARVAGRFGLDVGPVTEALLDFEAGGWVRRTSFAGRTGWSLTDAGRAENERRLAAELDRTGLRGLVAATHAEFLPLNQRFGRTCTDWQIRPTRADPMAANDHTDRRWDDRVLRDLTGIEQSFRRLGDQLARRLRRFDGYAGQFSAALRKVDAGQHAWIDAPDRNSCHLVWIQFHEDLLASLGIPRGTDTN